MTSDTTKKIASNTIYQFIGKFITMSVTILATVIITRMYGRDGYGAYNLMQTFPALFFIIVDFGLNAIAVKDLSEHYEKAEKYLGNILLLRLFLALVVMLIAGLLLVFIPYEYSLKTGIYLALLLVLTQSLFATSNIIFQVKLRYDLSTVGQVFGSVLILILVLVLSYMRVDIKWVSFSYVIGGILTFLVNALFINRLGLKIRFQFDKALSKYLLIQSLPLGLMFVFSQINFKMDSILISVMKLPSNIGLTNTESVAVYGLPYKIFEVSLVVPTFFMNSVYPVLIRHMLAGKEHLKATFLRVLGFLSIGGLVAGLCGVFLAPFIISALGGVAFEKSVLVLRLLLGGLIVFYTTQPLSWLIVTLGGQRHLPFIYLLGAIFNVGANILIIPIYSFYGSAVITVVSELIILFMLIFYALKSWNAKYA